MAVQMYLMNATLEDFIVLDRQVVKESRVGYTTTNPGECLKKKDGWHRVEISEGRIRSCNSPL